MHHVVPKKHRSTDDLANLWLVHHTCHRQIHSTRAPLGVLRWLEPGARLVACPDLRGGGNSDIISFPNQLATSNFLMFITSLLN